MQNVVNTIKNEEQSAENKKEEITVTANYERTKMQREMILQKLKEQGYRITKQRIALLDIILQEECSCCKEIYYIAMKQSIGIGSATVYRMINTLEEIGAINRKNMYKIACDRNCEFKNVCKIELDDDTVIELTAKKWNQVIKSGLDICGYLHDQNIKSIIATPCSCME